MPSEVPFISPSFDLHGGVMHHDMNQQKGTQECRLRSSRPPSSSSARSRAHRRAGASLAQSSVWGRRSCGLPVSKYESTPLAVP